MPILRRIPEVIPGFLDTHFHSLDAFATKMAQQDGVTTRMDLKQGAADPCGRYRYGGNPRQEHVIDQPAEAQSSARK